MRLRRVAGLALALSLALLNASGLAEPPRPCPACTGFEFVSLDYSGALDVQAFGCNDHGVVVGLAVLANGVNVGWLYDPMGMTFDELPPLDGYSFAALGINASGVIVGSVTVQDPYDPADPGPEDGFVLEHGRYTRFRHPGFTHTYPRAVGATGLVTGFAVNDPGDLSVGFIYDPARKAFTDIGFPGMYSNGAYSVCAQGIDARGRVVGSVFLLPGSAYPGSPAGSYGFVREPSGAVTLFRVKDQWTWARGINDAGVITGFFRIADGTRVGFVGTLPSRGGFRTMTNGEMLVVPFDGVAWQHPEAIDDTGRIVGTWIDESDHYHGFIATPVRGARDGSFDAERKRANP